MFTFTLQYGEAMKIAKKLAHSMSTEETRYYLNGFYVCRHEGENGVKYYAVSTDGHRLTRVTLLTADYAGEFKDFPNMIFPTEAVKHIEGFKLANRDKAKAIVTFTIDGLSYKIECNEQSFGGKLVDGNYPDFTRVIPDWKTFTNEYGDSGFNALYMADIVKAASYDASQFRKVHGRPVRMLFQDSNPAVIFEQDESVLYVLMPLRCSVGHHKHPEAEQAAEQATAA